MIAAAQVRYRDDDPAPFNMFGMLVVADQFVFVHTTITEEYLTCLAAKATPPTLNFNWWPKESRSGYPCEIGSKKIYGIHYGKAADRAIIVKTLCMLQEKFFAEINQS
jgi:hypothetical protein